MEWTNIPTFLNMYPKGKVLHIIRDPRDNYASLKSGAKNYYNKLGESEKKLLFNENHEVINASKPLDLSITKNVFSMFISLLLLGVILEFFTSKTLKSLKLL